jgi:predicted metal-binding protein
MTKKKSYVPIGKIKKHLRRLSFQRKEYTQAKNRAKVDKAVFKCESCGQLMYDGKSQNSFDKLKEKYDSIIWETPDLDHNNAVVEPKRGFVTWDEYLDRLFCGPDDMTVMCKACHKGVSREEMNERKEAGSLKRKK